VSIAVCCPTVLKNNWTERVFGHRRRHRKGAFLVHDLDRPRIVLPRQALLHGRIAMNPELRYESAADRAVKRDRIK
jgi:hypothetical protein